MWIYIWAGDGVGMAGGRDGKGGVDKSVCISPYLVYYAGKIKLHFLSTVYTYIHVLKHIQSTPVT